MLFKTLLNPAIVKTAINYIVDIYDMSVEKKNPLKRDQALNDATSGQMGEEPRSVPTSELNESKNRESRVKAARKISREI
jgi:hypothetical protein